MSKVLVFHPQIQDIAWVDRVDLLPSATGAQPKVFLRTPCFPSLELPAITSWLLGLSI